MNARVHRMSLAVYRWLPERARAAVVRRVANLHTVGALALIERADGSIALQRSTYRRGWGLPGGLVDRGEFPEQAIVREAREEVGVVVELLGEPAVVVDPAERRVDIVYRARITAGELRAASPEVAEAGWFAPGALPELQHEAVGAMAAMERLRHARW